MFNPIKIPLTFNEKIIIFVMINLTLWSIIFGGIYVYKNIKKAISTANTCLLHDQSIGNTVSYQGKDFKFTTFDLEEWSWGKKLSIELKEVK